MVTSILYQRGDYYVISAGTKGFEVYKHEVTAAVRVASIGHGPRHGLARAIAEVDRRASTP